MTSRNVRLAASWAAFFLLAASCGPSVPVADMVDGGSNGERDGQAGPQEAGAQDGAIQQDGRTDAAPPECQPGTQEDCYEGPPATLGRGRCTAGTRTCDSTGHWGPCMGQVLPQDEHCNNADDDCDGSTDEDVECLPLFADCRPEVDECAYPYTCVTHPGGLTYCDQLKPCADCDPDETCVTYPDGYDYCYRQPETTCWAHVFTDMTDGNEGSHLDSCMNCHGETGTTCTYAYHGNDLDLVCQGYMIWSRVGSPTNYWFDFMTVDFPFEDPQNVDTCLVAWGVFPLVRLEGPNPHSWIIRDQPATVRLVGQGGNTQPLQAGGLTTSLPASAFLAYEVASPPPPSVPNPQTKDERAALVFWSDPSAVNLQNTDMPYPYQGCDDCQTWGDLVEHLYPGPEIYCQGVGDNSMGIADSSFVVPIWLPYYDSYWNTRNLALVTEMVCRFGTGDTVDAVTLVAIPENHPDTLPQDYPYP